MNPHQKNKIDVSVGQDLPHQAVSGTKVVQKLSPDEQNLFRLYGKVPNKKDLLQNKLKVHKKRLARKRAPMPSPHLTNAQALQERKYFDSGDYALSKAGKASDSGVTSIGTEHPRADDIPHMSPLTHSLSRSDSISASSTSSNPNHPLSGEVPHIQTSPGMHRRSISGRPGGGLPGGASYSPVKESSFLARSASIGENEQAVDGGGKSSGKNQGQKTEGIPIRQ
ncbi:hypothetical protein DV736_g3463, partial [Chaetothyriales sp. CBS 134916]